MRDLDPEKLMEKISEQLCECDKSHKKVQRLKKFTYILKCDECGASGPLVDPDEEEDEE